MPTLTSRRFASYFFLLLALSLLFQGVANYLVDPYGIFNSGLVPLYDINPRYTKLERLTAQPQEYDALILGDCRGTVLDPTLATELFGHRYFNLATHNSQLIEPRAFVQHLLSRGMHVRQIMLNLGAFHFNTNARPAPITLEQIQSSTRDRLDTRWPSYLPHGGTVWPFLFSWPATKRSLLALHKMSTHTPATVVEHANGRWDWPEAEGVHDMAPESSRLRILDATYADLLVSLDAAAKPDDFDIPQGPFLHLDELRRFYSLAAKHNIEVIAFLPPVFALHGHFPWRGAYSEWKLRSLLEICGTIYDFGIYSPWTMDPRNFMTHENFTPELGDDLLRTIQAGESTPTCYRATKAGTVAYLKFKEAQEDAFQGTILPQLHAKPLRQWASVELRALAEAFPSPRQFSR